MPSVKQTTPQVASSLDSTVLDRKIFHQQRIKLGHGLRKMRFLRNPQKPPKQFQAIFGSNAASAPLAFKHVQTIVGQIAKNKPTYEFIMKNPAEIDIQSQGQRWASLMWQQLERQARKPLFWKWIDSIVADGTGVIKYTRHPWEDFPERDEDEEDESYIKKVSQFLYQKPQCPLYARVADPLTIFPSSYEWEPGDVLESGHRSLRDTLRQLRIAPVNGNMNALRVVEMGEPYPEDEVPLIPNGTMEVHEFWTPDNMYVGVEGSWFSIENPYEGIVPYVITGGETTANNDPALEFLSALFSFQRLQPWTDIMLMAMISWALGASNPIFTTSRQPGPGVTGSTDTAVEEVPWGKHMDLGLGGKAGWEGIPDVGNSIKGGIDVMAGMLDRTMLAPIVSGNMGSRSAGLATAGAVENALSVLIPMMENIQIGCGENTKMQFDFVKKVIKAPVYVSGFEMLEKTGFKKEAGNIWFGPDEIDMVQDVLVKMKQTSLQDDIQRGTHAAFMMEKGLWSQGHAMLYSGVEDIAKERREQAKDRARMHPIVQQYLATQAVADEPVLASLMEQAMMAEQQGEKPKVPQPTGEGGGGQSNQGGAAPRGGGRPTGSPSAGLKGPNQTQAPAGRRY